MTPPAAKSHEASEEVTAGQPDRSEMESHGDLAHLKTYCDNIGTGFNFQALTEDNLKRMEDEFKSRSNELEQKVDSIAGLTMSVADRARLSSLEKAVADGKVDPRSSMGVIFRAALKNSKDAPIYAGLNRDEASKFRIDWAQKSLKKFREEKIHKKSWKRVDLTKGDYLSASQLVISDGGWSDPEAVKGAQRLIEKAVAMGTPWVKEHPPDWPQPLPQAQLQLRGGVR